MRTFSILLTLILASGAASAASKPHVVSLGKTTPVKLFVGPTEDKTIDITVRPLYVDTRLKEFTIGKPHDVTEREFVVRRAYRINDALPNDAKAPRWQWQLGGWLVVNRDSGRIKSIPLPDFDPFYSEVSWYRDYAAYCGITANGERLNAVVSELGTRKPLFHKELGKPGGGLLPDSDCEAPRWERQPARVTFLPTSGEKLNVTVHGRFADEVDSSEEE